VESGVKYVKNNFVPLRDFHSVAHSNELLRAWIMGEAGNRIHGSSRERPLKLFAETEKALLQALPARRSPFNVAIAAEDTQFNSSVHADLPEGRPDSD